MYYKIVEDNYIKAIGTGPCPENGTEIDISEFSNIHDILRNRPVPEDGYDFHLTAGLEWEKYALPVTNEDEELMPEEVLAIILGEGIA